MDRSGSVAFYFSGDDHALAVVNVSCAAGLQFANLPVVDLVEAGLHYANLPVVDLAAGHAFHPDRNKDLGLLQ